jgi:hypothetical protein
MALQGKYDMIQEEELSPLALTFMNAVKEISRMPGNTKTIAFDTFSVYYEALVNKYAELFLKREIRSVGHKGEYYTLQPRDYQPINREASNMVRLLLKSDLNIICLCQQKDVWGDNMKVEGTTFDGWKRLAYYFDTVLEISSKNKKQNTFNVLCHKDRSYHLQKNEIYPWGTDADVCAWLFKAGFDLTNGPAATSFVEPEPEKASTVEAETSLSSPDTAVQELATDPDPIQQPAAPAQSKDDLLHEIVALKQACRINGPDWQTIIKPFKVKTAKDMNNTQLLELIANLKEIKNSPARAA